MKIVIMLLWACAVSFLVGLGFVGLAEVAQTLQDSRFVYQESAFVAGSCLTLAWLVYRWGVRTQGM